MSQAVLSGARAMEWFVSQSVARVFVVDGGKSGKL
jgi:hypothetical protein